MCRVKEQLTVCISLFLLFSISAHAQIRVTQSGAPDPTMQDGSSWENALSAAKLKERLSGVSRGGSAGEYWLAAGAYPALFPQLGVEIYGGFNGTEKQRSERDPSTNQTTIFGISFAAYEVRDQNNNLIERKHPGEGTIIDGCTLFASEAGLALSGNYSPGIALEGSPLVQNCKIVGSPGFASVVNVGHGPLKIVDSEIRAGLGAGLSVGGQDGFVELINCQIRQNGEAGLISWNGGKLKATGCLIENNGRDASSRTPPVSRYSGLYVQEASAEIINCIITKNQGDLGGGITAVFTEPHQHRLLVSNSTISSNTTVAAGRMGGGIHSWTFNSTMAERVIITNTVITANTNLSTTGAGGAYVYGPSTHLENCKVINNHTAGNGGGLFVYTPKGESLIVPRFRNLLIANNTAVNGGGLYLQTTDARIINCTVAHNQATNQGGAIFSDGERSPFNTPPALQKPALLANTALIGNSAAQGTTLYHLIVGFFDPGNEPVPPQFTNSAYSSEGTFMRRRFGNNEPLPTPPGLIAVDPAQFIAPGNYHFATNSPLIDAGANSFATEFDLELNPRIFGPSIDIGAYESLLHTDPEPLTVMKLENGLIRIQFTGRLQFTPSLTNPSWQTIDAATQIDLSPQGQSGFWRTVDQ